MINDPVEKEPLVSVGFQNFFSDCPEVVRQKGDCQLPWDIMGQKLPDAKEGKFTEKKG